MKNWLWRVLKAMYPRQREWWGYSLGRCRCLGRRLGQVGVTGKRRWQKERGPRGRTYSGGHSYILWHGKPLESFDLDRGRTLFALLGTMWQRLFRVFPLGQ